MENIEKHRKTYGKHGNKQMKTDQNIEKHFPNNKTTYKKPIKPY